MPPVPAEFRIASPDDHRVVVGLLRELIEELGPAETAARVVPRLDEDVTHALGDSEHVCIMLAETPDEPIGLVRGDVLSNDPIFRLRKDNRCGYIDQMFVRPAYRGKGLGTELLRRCEEWFRDQGIGHSLLHAAPKATRFYARHGYQPNREMFKRL